MAERLGIFVLTCCLGIVMTPLAPAADDRGAAEDAAVAELITGLGSADYAGRERAQAELAKKGLTAFEALYDAQHHKDIEIATRARYLVRGMTVNWFLDTDPKDIQIILRDYNSLEPGERLGRVNQLLQKDTPQALAAVCRLVRYEIEPETSKQIALELMERTLPLAEEGVKALLDTIERVIGSGKRPGSLWLRAYASSLRDPAGSVREWNEIVREELETLSLFPQRTSPTICRDLIRQQVKLLKSLKKADEADAAIVQSLALTDGSKEQLTELIDWLASQDAWKHVLTVYERNKEIVEATPALLYRLAEAQLKLGRTDEGEALAAKALKINPEILEEHLLTGYGLKENGRFDWAEKELRLVLAGAPAGSPLDLRTRFILSEMLHDIGKDLVAAETLKKVIDTIDDDENAEKTIDRLGRTAEATRSRMHYFFALDHLEKGDRAKHLQQLNEAVKFDKTDADVLIALHRAADLPAERRKEISKLIADAADDFRQEMTEARQQAERAPNEPSQKMYETQLATSCNQFAWLVGNTEGDYQEAIRASKRSLEIKTNEPGYLDTLAHCYFTAGEYENAVRYQREAVRLDAHSGQLGRALARFEKKLAEVQKKD